MLTFLPLFSVCGIRLSLRCGAFCCLRPDRMLRGALEGKGEEAHGMTPVQAASTALAATVGTGNVIGTAQAVAMGGPGAVFWLWIAAFMGMWVKYAEILLGQSCGGGAMGYIRAALGRKSAGIYAALAVLSALFVGNMAQMNGAVRSLCRLLGENGIFWKLGAGLALTAFAGLCILGGAGRVGRITELLTPLMALSYLIVTGCVLLVFRERLTDVLRMILREAFRPAAIAGAAGGCALRRSILWGLRRGAFSNEAGLGTAANIHAFSPSRDPAAHALWGVFEVFADSIVICSATAFAILCSGVSVPFGTLPGAELLERAIGAGMGDRAAAAYLCVILLLFGMSTVIGCCVSAEHCVDWLLQGRGRRAFRFVYLLCAAAGAVLPLEFVWKAADSVNVLLALPNLLALLLLAPKAGRLVRRGFSRQAGGERPPGEPLTSSGKMIY